MVALNATVKTDNDSCCRPGDITVTPIPSGFMVGRALPEIGQGPWWQYIKVVGEYEDAMQLALQLADEDNARAWYHRQNDEYDEIR
jgi:hypothetical protein